jgi:hypothetical protein
MPQHSDIAKTILATATERGNDKSTCPSEIARMMFPDDWRKNMKEIRMVAVELHQNGKVIITQKGEPVDINNIKGPIRIKIK